MRRKRPEPLYQRFSRLLVAALTGQAPVTVTVSVYALIALLLLAYVSAQVLTGVLNQDIKSLQQDVGRQREQLNKLTAEYVALSSRAQVSEYCEQKLGMIEAPENSFRRIAVVSDAEQEAFPVELTHRENPVVEPYHFSTVLKAHGKSDG